MEKFRKKLWIAAVIFLTLFIFRTNIAEAIEMVTGCPNITDNGVTLFDSKYCSGDRVNFDTPGTYNLNDFSFSNIASSDYVKWGWSVKLSNGSEEVCHNWAAWNFSKDKFPNQDSLDNSINQITVYDSPNCVGDDTNPTPTPVPSPTATPSPTVAPTTTPTPQPATGCPGITDDGVTVFENAYCSGNSKNYSEGYFDLSQDGFENKLTSVYVKNGWSVRLSSADQSICKNYSAWNFGIDNWPNASSMNDSIQSIEVFSTPNCPGVQPTSTPRPTPTPTATPTPSTDEVKLLNIFFIPDGVTPFFDPADLTNQLIPAMKETSHDKVQYTVVDQQTVNRSTTKKTNGRMDYNALVSEFDVCSRLNNGEIDEVWVWVNGADGAGWEWLASGSINYPEYITPCGKDFVVMGFDYTRHYELAMHSMGHRMEFIARATHYNDYIAWDTRNDKYSTPYNTEIPLPTEVVGCGNVHFPPNGQKHYDYVNTGEVQSNCTGQVETISCTTWGCSQEGFMKWWFDKIPTAWWSDFLRR